MDKATADRVRQRQQREANGFVTEYNPTHEQLLITINEYLWGGKQAPMNIKTHDEYARTRKLTVPCNPSHMCNHQQVQETVTEIPKTSAWDRGPLAAVSAVAFVVAMPIVFPAAVAISAANKVRHEYKKSGLWSAVLMALVFAAGLYFLFTPTPGCDMYGTTYSCAR